VKTKLFILKLGIISLLFSHIYAEEWGVSLTAVDADGIGAHHTIQLGNCTGCSDGWKFGEDEDDYPDPFSGEFTNIHFFHLDWYGNEDEYGNICNQFKFSTDFRSIHQNYDLLSWGIRGYTGNGLPYDIPINLSWDAAAVDNLSDDYELYIYIGEVSYNMREINSITAPQNEFYLDEENNPNVRVLLGACASTGTTMHYLDVDNDGWGGEDISHDFCQGFAPEGWALNSDDLDDDLFCESNLIDDCNVCDGFNQDMDCYGFCFGDAYEDDCSVCGGDNSSCEDCAGIPNGDNVVDNCGTCDNDSSNDCILDCADTWGGNLVEDECGVCDGDGIHQECGCGSSGEFGIPDGDCDCEGHVVDCADVCGGTSTIETLCEDTDGDGLGNSGTETVECVDLINNRLDGCDLPDLTLFLNSDGTVIYNSSIPFAGFQFDVDGSSIIGNSGGDAESAGFFVSFNDNTAIGFSLTGALLPAGCGDLLTLSLEGEASGLSGIVVSDNNGNPISFSNYEGYDFNLVLDCSDEYPYCFYNYYGCLGECGGPVEIDECGICGGPGTVYCGGGIYECNQEYCPDTIDYCLELHEGANLISFYGLPDDASITNIMYSIEEIATGVIGEGVAANNVNGEWAGSLSTISSLAGYWVIVNEIGSLCIKDAMPTNTTIEYNLQVGANLISFPAEGSIELLIGLPDDIEGSIIGIIGEGVATNNVNGVWSGSLSNFAGGEGYWVIATDYISFSFEISSLNRIKTSNSIGFTNPPGFEAIQSTQQAFYFINEIKTESADEFNDGWIISYHYGKVTGSREWKGDLIDIPVMGIDENSYSQGYLHTGETPHFKYLDNTTGKLTDLYHGDIPQWENNGIYILGNMGVKEILPKEIMLSTYPNPFNPTTTLSFTVQNEGMLQLSIYNISGQLVSELAHEYRTSGNVEYIWDATNHPSGVYLARLNINNIFYTKKLVLMK